VTKNSGLGRLAIEGLTIIASILLAFGIDAWWDARKERLVEGQYLSALRVEFQNGLDEVSSDLQNQETLRSLLSYFVRQSSVPPDSLRTILRLAASVNNIAPPTSVMEEIVSSGRLQVIRSAELRESIVAYRQMLEKLEINERVHHDFVNERFIPYLSANIPLWGIVGPIEREAALRSASDEELEALQRDERFKNIMVERLTRLQRGLPRVRSTKEQLEVLASLLAAP
jgi:hypothetical protein